MGPPGSRLLDDELSRPATDDPAVLAALAEVADGYMDAVAGLFDYDPDLRVER